MTEVNKGVLDNDIVISAENIQKIGEVVALTCIKTVIVRSGNRAKINFVRSVSICFFFTPFALFLFRRVKKLYNIHRLQSTRNSLHKVDFRHKYVTMTIWLSTICRIKYSAFIN